MTVSAEPPVLVHGERPLPRRHRLLREAAGLGAATAIGFTAVYWTAEVTLGLKGFALSTVSLFLVLVLVISFPLRRRRPALAAPRDRPVVTRRVGQAVREGRLPGDVAWRRVCAVGAAEQLGALVLIVPACVVVVWALSALFPGAAPWLVAVLPLAVLPPLTAPAHRGWAYLGLYEAELSPSGTL
ncbi:hypothetical protein GCM10011374_14400 [Kocuria dechangensis]|uniref:Uncharacterized protein n=1 Tax=Kocuria dechangensis TaxID=1176249 RepID=A0A917GPE6_9MICC|nr:hypothetical protein [Kocuria dechangensis]GGG52716.1 hypothetical protein GCM10011374_14400 [Kocuria dechangensis]